MAALLLAMAALAMALPEFVESFSWSGGLGFSPPPDWQHDLWIGAFFVGTTSFVLALVREREERRRHSRSGRRLAGLTLVIATLGACVWILPALVVASEGL